MIDPNFLNPLKLLCRSSCYLAQAVTSLKLLPRSSCFSTLKLFHAQAVSARSSCFSALKLFLKNRSAPSSLPEELSDTRLLSRSYSASTQRVCSLKWRALLMTASH